MTADAPAAFQARSAGRAVWVIAVIALFVAVAALGVAIANPTHRSVKAGLSGADQVPESWANYGQQLQARTHAKWVLPSMPIDIQHNGTYLMDYGPLSGASHWPPGVGHGFGSVAPANRHFQSPPAPQSVGRVVTIRGAQYVQFKISVQNLSRPYRGYYAWLYGS